MADRRDIEAAAAAGVIAHDQVGPLADFLAARQAPAGGEAVADGEETLRFIRNFHDVFLATGIVLFAIGMAIAAGTAAPAILGDGGLRAVAFGGVLALCAAVMWVLGELFARRRRLFLPAIAIVTAMTLYSVFAAGFIVAGLTFGGVFSIDGLEEASVSARAAVLFAFAFFVVTPLAFYARFRLPFSLGLAGAGASLFVVTASFFADWERAGEVLPLLLLGLGLVLFLAGVAFDARDPGRATRFSDNGFWLHFAAAPLILNGAFGLITRAFDGSIAMNDEVSAMAPAAPAAAAATLGVVFLLGFVSLLINRRALIVSALLTAGIAIGVLMDAVGLDAGALVASTLIVLGGFVLILGAGWRGARRVLLSRVRPEGAWARIFPPESVTE